jgi:acetate---CoA ligase (ADP-forming)
LTELSPDALWERLHGTFVPSSVALVGASDDSGWSRTVFRQWGTFCPGLPIYCVNPSRPTVHGQRSYPSLRDIDGPVDLVYVMTSSAAAVPVLTEAAEIGIRHAVVLSGGFAEAGPAGAGRQAALSALCRGTGLNVLGPNCNGFINVSDMRVVYGGPLLPPLMRGQVGIISQSGAIATRLVAMAQLRAIGLSMVVTVGNEAAISATTMMRYLVLDPHTTALAVFAEAIADIDEFKLAMTEAAAVGKPVVILKVGRSDASQNAARDHTGAITGDDAVASAAMAQWGAIRVRSLEDLMVTAGYLASTPAPAGNRLAVVGASGGAGEIIADRAMDEGLDLPDLSAEVAAELKSFLPEGASIGNPLDVTGRVVLSPELLTRAVEIVRSDPTTDSVLVYTTMPRVPPADATPLRDFFSTIAALNGSPGPGVSVIAQGAADLSDFTEIIAAERLAVFDNIDNSLTAIGKAVWWAGRLPRVPLRDSPGAARDTPGAARDTSGTDRDALVPAVAGGQGEWGERRSLELLRSHGLPVVPAVLARSAAEAADAARSLGPPVAVKAASDELLHKSDAGGVVLNVMAPDAAARAYDQVLAGVAASRPGLALDGVLVSPMRTGGVELLVSVSTDAQWGKILTVGLGGIWVEVLADVSRRVLPIGVRDIRDMFGELRGAGLLAGGRGRQAADVGALARVVHEIAEVGLAWGDRIATVEINPLWINGGQIEVLDALVLWSGDE